MPTSSQSCYQLSLWIIELLKFSVFLRDFQRMPNGALWALDGMSDLSLNIRQRSWVPVPESLLVAGQSPNLFKLCFFVSKTN